MGKAIKEAIIVDLHLRVPSVKWTVSRNVREEFDTGEGFWERPRRKPSGQSKHLVYVFYQLTPRYISGLVFTMHAVT